jgi:hypothetical protein
MDNDTASERSPPLGSHRDSASLFSQGLKFSPVFFGQCLEKNVADFRIFCRVRRGRECNNSVHQREGCGSGVEPPASLRQPVHRENSLDSNSATSSDSNSATSSAVFPLAAGPFWYSHRRSPRRKLRTSMRGPTSGSSSATIRKAHGWHGPRILESITGTTSGQEDNPPCLSGSVR